MKMKHKENEINEEEKIKINTANEVEKKNSKTLERVTVKTSWMAIVILVCFHMVKSTIYLNQFPESNACE